MGISRVGKYKIEYDNKKEFRILSKEIFKDDIYNIDIKKESPVIIDAGAHIGLATLYFKSIYPKASIIAIEPNKDNFELLEKNIENNALEDIVLINKALGKRKGIRDFFVDNTDDNWYSTSSYSVGAWTGSQQNRKIEVETIPLSELLDSPIDLLKLDIEGAEYSVLEEAKDKLVNVKNIIMEYHPINKNHGKKILRLLNEIGYNIKIFVNNKKANQLPKDRLAMVKATK